MIETRKVGRAGSHLPIERGVAQRVGQGGAAG